MFPSVAPCAALGQHRSMQRKLLRGREDGEQLMADVIGLAGQLAATATARLQLCCSGRSPTEGSNASWVECAAQTAQTRAPSSALMDRGRPVTELISEIHEGDPSLRRGWPLQYWGLEPFDQGRSDWQIRYASVFQHSGTFSETISAATDRVLTRQAMSSSMPARAGSFNSGSDLRAIERRGARPHRRRSLEGIESMTCALVRADRPGVPIPNVEGIGARGPAS